jgi:hypothetical protein
VSPPGGSVPRWRIAAAAAILAGLLGMLAVLSPAYFHNLDLQSYVSGLSHDESARLRPDEAIRTQIVEKAHALGLPVTDGNVHITRGADGKLEHIDVHYFVDVSLPGYTVKLHFYPGAASQ